MHGKAGRQAGTDGEGGRGVLDVRYPNTTLKDTIEFGLVEKLGVTSFMGLQLHCNLLERERERERERESIREYH